MRENALLESLTTDLSWDDLVLDAQVRKDVDEIIAWTRHAPPLVGGYRSLFLGPLGPCKRQVAALIGKESGRPAYRVDLGAVLSKSVGETRKALESLFEKLGTWILFFDEADALFGRHSGEPANDRQAEQQIAYLLQRIEDFPGVAILASNVASHVDEAFARRFQSTIRFAGTCTVV